jgi:hypothetical protein
MTALRELREKVARGRVSRRHAAPPLPVSALHGRRPTMADISDETLEEAARMVDCGCECREAVLSATTETERWSTCGCDPCGALVAAAIRAMKG